MRGVAGPLTRQWRESVTRLAALAGVRPSPDALRVVVAGGSGTLGRALSADLACRGHEVVVLTRSPQADLPHRQRTWDGETVGPWAEVLREQPGRTAVVNLAGRLVDVRPTAANVRDLLESRVRPTLALAEASRLLSVPLAAWVQGSTTAIWTGRRGGARDRVDPAAHRPRRAAADDRRGPPLGGRRRRGERRSDRPAAHLDRPAGRLPGLRPPRRTDEGGARRARRVRAPVVQRVHVEDWLAIVRRALGVDLGPSLDGVVVAAAPEPVRNADLMAALRHHLRRPASTPTPELLVRLGSVPLRTDPALGLTGRRCTSETLAAAGFAFAHPDLDGALADLLS